MDRYINYFKTIIFFTLLCRDENMKKANNNLKNHCPIIETNFPTKILSIINEIVKRYYSIHKFTLSPCASSRIMEAKKICHLLEIYIPILVLGCEIFFYCVTFKSLSLTSPSLLESKMS